ncbi:MAG: carbohydrate kinase, partial [Clostridiales bacterium]|nr:carbohydrate kinase [Clostridiales bacterium]
AILTYKGTIDALTEEAFPDDLLYSTHHLHIGSYYLMSKLQAGLPDIARRAKGAGMSISMDTNWDPEEKWGIVESLLPYVDVLLPNEQELRALGGEEFLRKHVPLIIVKEGAEGARAIDRSGTVIRAAAFPVPFVDAIGAGDSFDAGYICAWLEGRSVLDCLSIACACGSANVMSRGGTAGQANREKVARMVAERGIEFGQVPL